MSEQILNDFIENQGQYLTLKNLIDDKHLNKNSYKLNETEF